MILFSSSKETILVRIYTSAGPFSSVFFFGYAGYYYYIWMEFRWYGAFCFLISIFGGGFWGVCSLGGLVNLFIDIAAD